MAICNLLGSNIFDILFCLGGPWVIKALMSGIGVVIQSEAMTYTALTLLTSVVVLFLTMMFMGWKINVKTGVLCLILYAIFLVMSCLYEFLIIGVAVTCD